MSNRKAEAGMSTELERVRHGILFYVPILEKDLADFERLVREDERAKLKPFLNKQVLDERVRQTIDRFLARRER